MDNNFFLNTGIPPSLHFEPSPSMPAWRSFSSAMDILPGDRNVSSAARSPESYYNSYWDSNKHSSDHQNLRFESASSSMVSSPVASNSNNMSNESFVIRELIGKLGSIGSTTSTNDIANNASCYSTPLNSPPKMKLTIADPTLNSSRVAEFSADPGFAELAAKFSCFGSRSFNGRTANQIGGAANNSSEMGFRSNQLTRVSSSPSLKALGSQTEQRSLQLPSSRGLESKSTLVSENQQTQMKETSMVPSSSTDLSSRKRKTASKAKATVKVAEASDISDLNAKRCKANDNGNTNNNGSVKTDEDANKGCSSSDEKGKSYAKPPEPFKDYIHVRARRGQATDSHSLAERVRREKISERMKLLQDLVPGCNKVTGKALMLDEIINYVQSLQRQVEFLSMKLSSVNTRLDFNMDALMSKEIFQQQQQQQQQQGGSLPHPIFPSDSSAQSIYGHQQNPQHCSVDPLESALCQTLGMQLPSLNAYTESMPQFPAFGEDDLHTIVQMGFGQNPNKETEFNGSNQSSHMKIEL